MNATTVFPIIPAAGKAITFIYVMAGLMVLTIALLGFIAWSTRNVTFTVSPEGLRIRGDLYGRLIPMQSLVLADAAAIDLAKETEYQPKWRTNGVGLPGYASGWFRLRNGGKALLFVTDRRHVARIPTKDGYTFMATVADPQALIAALRSQAPAS